MPDLLLELFSEEIPARFQARAAADLKKSVTNALVDAGLTYEAASDYWTPRRIVLDLRGLTIRSADIREERKGPRTDAPDKAVEGFLRSAGLASRDAAEIRKDPKKGDYYVAIINKPGRPAEEIIAQIMPEIIGNFPWPKSMRWGENSAQPGSLRWVRPLQSILCLLDQHNGEPAVVEFEIGGIRSGNITFGHRFMAPEPIRVRRFDDYVASLEKARVIVDAERRQEIILADAKNLAFAQGLALVEDEKLLLEVANLVEWPVVLMGEFDQSFLDIPDEVVQLTIRANQKCFVLRGADGALTNKFLLVANIEASDGGVEVARGNSRVVAARLADAKFFWQSDLAGVRGESGFEPWIEKLDQVTFHAKLGSQGERVKRIAALAKELAPLVGADPKLAERAANLAKADLVSAMVIEFPELQGLMGRYYAEQAGEDAAVANAIEQHYKPQGPSDDVPNEPVSIAVALADKLDTLAGFWAIDEKPTGSKDPFALRRAALGAIRLVLENGVRLRLAGQIIRSQAILAGQGNVGDQVPNSANAADLLAFFHDRLKVYLRDKGIRHDLIDAVLAPSSGPSGHLLPQGEKEDAGEISQKSSSPLVGEDSETQRSEAELSVEIGEGLNDDLLAISQRAGALQKFIDTDEGTNLLAGTKRAANILAAEQKKGTKISATVNAKLFNTGEERALYAALEEAEKLAQMAIEKEDYAKAMAVLSQLRAPIDNFFEHVMVNDENDKIRANRLALMGRIRAATATVADFSKISG